MKIIKYLTLSIVAFTFLFSCSSDDVTGSETQQQLMFSGNFFPLTIADSWSYDVINTDNTTNEVTTSEDVLVVESESSTGFTLSANANQGGIANGTMSGILTTGELTRTNTTLATNLNISLPLDGFDFDIELENALLYNTQASNGDQLSLNTGIFTQDFEGYPITINYALKSKQLGNLTSLEVEGTTYNTVTSANISLELSVSTTVTAFGFTQTVSILDAQDVLSIDSFYAENVGLIKAEADTSYTLNPTTLGLLQQAGVDLSLLPTSMSVQNTQSLTSYNITE
ncbi:hypothetical protein [Lacinutrix algicola]|uniref:hypothetical protein n=1 Tax=Lacinutrix algicola TaxID=342954 RepID=UPI0006E3BB66|nr:hypothetical protein [Lacinutrix algicola]